MKRPTSLLLCAGFAIGAMALAPRLSAGRPDGDKAAVPAHATPTPEELQRMMEAWQATIAPGEEHKKLEVFAGEWDTVLRTWPGGPGAPAAESTGSATATWSLGGRFLEERFSGGMMGMPFEGVGYLGFDRFKKMYTMTWMNTMGTNTIVATGAFNPVENAFLLFGTTDEPMTGQHDKTVMYRIRLIDDDTHTFEVHDLEIGGNNTRVIEVTYNRHK